MDSGNLKQYIFDSSDKNKTVKLEFHRNIVNDIKIITEFKNCDGSGTFSVKSQFDFETANHIKWAIEEYIDNQYNTKRIENQKEKMIGCSHTETESSFPYGDLVCKNCGKLV